MPRTQHFFKRLQDKINRKNPKQNEKSNKKDKNKVGKISKSEKRGPITRDDIVQPMPTIREVNSPEEKRALFIRKLRLCSYVFNFQQESKAAQSGGLSLAKGSEKVRSLQEDKLEGKAREKKREMLVELIDHLSTSRTWVSEDSLKAILHMISCNLFRPLPPSLYGDDFDPDEDEPTHDPAWVHLQFVYEFLLRFIVSNNTDAKLLKKFIDRKFLLSIIELFGSEDPRERDYLKTILHRIYGKFMSFRSFLRRAINNEFYSVIYRSGKHNGLAELLEILGSIINGFATPLKEEHQSFLRKVLIPLHKCKCLSQFHAQLAYCIVQFIEKDPRLASPIICGLLRFWPQTSCSKELLFLSELEEVLEMTEQQQFQQLIDPLFKRIAACIGSLHFQVAERALFLWNNDVIATFMSDHRKDILPLLYPALQSNINNHWNPTVMQLTQHIMQQFRDMDTKLYNLVQQRYKTQTNQIQLFRNKRNEKWNKLGNNHNKYNTTTNGKYISTNNNGTNTKQRQSEKHVSG